jgi:DNA-binding cell septation regulator SpoVG
MRITEVRIFAIGEGNLLAHADITIDHSFTVRDLQIFRRPRGYYVAMPQVKQASGTYREIAFAINAHTRKMIEQAVIVEYKKVTGNPVRKARH